MGHKYTKKLFIIHFSGSPRPGLPVRGKCDFRAASPRVVGFPRNSNYGDFAAFKTFRRWATCLHVGRMGGYAGLTAGAIILHGLAVGDRPRQRHLIGIFQLPAKCDPPGNCSDPQRDILQFLLDIVDRRIPLYRRV